MLLLLLIKYLRRTNPKFSTSHTSRCTTTYHGTQTDACPSAAGRAKKYMIVVKQGPSPWPPAPY